MTVPLDPDELRRRRLAAFGQGPGQGPETFPGQAPAVPPATRPLTDSAAIQDSKPTSGTCAPAEESSGSPHVLNADDVSKIWQLLFPPDSTQDDKRRWNTQGFRLCSEPTFGLQQGEGGPCGVLAAVNAEMLRSLIFGPGLDSDRGSGLGRLPTPSQDEAQSALASALSMILCRAFKAERAGTLAGPREGVAVVTLAPGTDPGSAGEFILHRVPLPEDGADAAQEELAAALLLSSLYDYASPRGVILFVLSLVLSRGLESVRADMDGEDCYLTGQFGHCAQELTNLALCGTASSNVFDGAIPMGESGLTLRGIPSRASVGYLTQLEALRYCQVGSYYKNPLDPVWVMGSTSHFTVLFGVDRAVAEGSESERLLEKVQRAFKAADTMEAGFIPVDKLGQLLGELLPHLKGDQSASSQIEALAAKLEMPGAGIIVWSDFWKAVSRLMTGATLQAVMQDEVKAATPAPRAAGGSGAGAHEWRMGDSNTTTSGNRPRSDSDIARELQQQFDGGDMDAAVSTLAGMAHAAGPQGGQQGGGGSSSGPRPRSDSDIARELQREFDASDMDIAAASTPSSTPAVPASSSAPLQSPPQSGGPAGPSALENRLDLRTDIHRHDSVAADDVPSYDLYHYNGMVSGSRTKPSLVRFKLLRRSSDDAVGREVALDGGASTAGSAYGCPIEEVLRTRWPGCRLDWLGQRPPSID